MRNPGRSKRLICCVLAWGAAMGAVPAQAASFPWTKSVKETAYFEGLPVEYSPGRAKHGEKLFRLGPWELGPRLASQEKDDKRPNLYVVVPGSAQASAIAPDYNHNLVLSAVPKGDDAADFDVYWAVVLDPHLKEDIRAETQLLLAAQEPLIAGDNLKFSDIPSQAFLREFLHIDSLDQLAEYRRPDGTLPKVAIITAKFAIRAKVSEPASLPEDQPQETATDPSATKGSSAPR